ncbi:small acid-soluble spore protein Tlp [Bacillus sp. RG28]|uniref:Small, acid-soluble spore protein Tlp n=1 Tax=Gottfriedia endophytica TaxID=2820819 RepID=A0A940SJX5_9BACI|nr:small acid-soluble spore protein Tlp [Gottfriedia endophytica]MBP0725911.1 small acid-soluble spore protein Tlp [Gottfriedia endophytica]
MEWQAKPDDRSDNAEKIRNTIENTKENMRKADFSMKFSNEQDKQNAIEKNQRRKESIEGLQKELQEEQAFSNRND